MHQQCLVAEFENTQKARVGLQVLGKAGFDQNQVSTISRCDDPELENLAKLAEGGADNPGSVSGAGDEQCGRARGERECNDGCSRQRGRA